jgi:hypothetical protein
MFAFECLRFGEGEITKIKKKLGDNKISCTNAFSYRNKKKELDFCAKMWKIRKSPKE